jgi:hypothetical protein
VDSSCEHNYARSGSIKDGEFLDYVSDYQFHEVHVVQSFLRS